MKKIHEKSQIFPLLWVNSAGACQGELLFPNYSIKFNPAQAVDGVIQGRIFCLK